MTGGAPIFSEDPSPESGDPEGRVPEEQESSSGDLLPTPPPLRIEDGGSEMLPGTGQAEGVEFVRLPHWHLVKKLKIGDQDALSWIMETYRPALLRYAQRLSGNTADSEDIVQEAFFRLWSRRATLRPTGSIRAFLFISVRTIARDEYRRWGRRRSRFQDPAPDRPAADDPSADAQGSELLLSLNGALEALSPRRKEVFRLIRLEGHTIEETARALDLSPRTIKNTMSAALAELRKNLGPFLE